MRFFIFLGKVINQTLSIGGFEGNDAGKLTFKVWVVALLTS
ncbi:hypothetical protein Q5692_34535 [Microcoleus sp. C2C3]